MTTRHDTALLVESKGINIIKTAKQGHKHKSIQFHLAKAIVGKE
jgi:hypothetical protein